MNDRRHRLPRLARAALGLAVALATLGCSDGPPPPGARLAAHAEPSAAPGEPPERRGVEPPSAAPGAPPERRGAEASLADPPPCERREVRPPTSFRAVALGRPERDAAVRPDALDRWARDGALAREVRVASLQRLTREDAESALDAASDLTADPEALEDPLLGPNAVAALARSDDPRAAEALGRLPERYQRLAAAVRRAEGR